MGRFLKEVSVKVGLVGIAEPTARNLIDRLTTTAAFDPGTFEAMRFATLSECRSAVNSLKVNAICISLESFTAENSTNFIGDIRVTHPLIPFCLVGTSSFLGELPAYHQAWRNRLSHYYKLSSDVEEGDFAENAGLLRDLLVADAVKCRALGNYDTTPGSIVRLQAPRPFGFWVLVFVTLVAALVGGAIGPVLQQILPSAADVNRAAQQPPPP